MGSCVVHFDSRGDKLARGMAWPISAESIKGAWLERHETEIWVTMYRSEIASEWARRKGGGESNLVCASYEKQLADLEHYLRHTDAEPPAWTVLDDPPLVGVAVKSVPADVLKECCLTKQIMANVFKESITKFVPHWITESDWKIDFDLELDIPRLRVRSWRRSVREWKLEKEWLVPLGD